MFHTVAYMSTMSTVPTGTTATTLFSIAPVADSLCATSGTGLLMPYDLKVIAGFAASANITKARLNAPSLYRVALPYIVPVSATAATVGSTSGATVSLAPLPPHNPNFFVNLSNPTAVRASEPLGVDYSTAVVTTSQDTGAALLWLCDKIDPIPAGDAFWLRYRDSTTSTVPLQWTSLSSFSWDQTPAPGTYAVVGLSHFCPYGIAARINFPGQVFRPGALCINNNLTNVFPGESRTHAVFYEGTLGLYGTFQTFAPPIIEVLTAAPSTVNEGFLRVVRIGDIGSMSAGR